MKRLSYILVLAVFVIALAVQVIPVQAYPVGNYSKIYEGIEYATGYTTSPRLMRAFGLRVNLCNPDTWLFASPGNGGNPYETTLQTTPAFLSQYGAQYGVKVAVNSNFWDVATSPNVDVLGLLISNGGIVSYAQQNYGWLAFTSDKSPDMEFTATTPSGKWQACGGGYIILNNGVIVTSDGTVNPLTGYGISQDGHRLIMVCVDGRQPGWSDGCSEIDLAQWLKDFGAWWGMRMDGGGSTSMAISGMNNYYGCVNKPCYGYARSVGASFGCVSNPGNKIGPDACSMNANRIDVVVRGNLAHVCLKTWTSAGGWAAPVDLGGTNIQDNAAICSVADGRLDVFYCDAATHMIRMKTWTSAGGWTGWSDVGNYFYSVAVCRRDATHIDLAGRDTNNVIWHRTYTTSTATWSSWTNLGGTTYDTPGIAYNGSVCVFNRGTDNRLWIKWRDGGGVWHGWDSLGGAIDGTPTAICRTGVLLDVYARGTDFMLKHISMNSSGVWGAWESLGGNVTKIAVFAPDANTIKTYHRDTSDNLIERNWTTSGGWSGWIYQGSCFY